MSNIPRIFLHFHSIYHRCSLQLNRLSHASCQENQVCCRRRHTYLTGRISLASAAAPSISKMCATLVNRSEATTAKAPITTIEPAFSGTGTREADETSPLDQGILISSQRLVSQGAEFGKLISCDARFVQDVSFGVQTLNWVLIREL